MNPELQSAGLADRQDGCLCKRPVHIAVVRQIRLRIALSTDSPGNLIFSDFSPYTITYTGLSREDTLLDNRVSGALRGSEKR